jgi:hypothetical protein
MSSALENLRRERQRKLQVRETFSRGLQRFRAGTQDPVPFYEACADYLVAGQRRLIDQDLRLAEMLAARVPARQTEDHAAIGALRERLDLADRSLREFAVAAEDLRRRGSAAKTAFERAADAFLEVLVNVLGKRSHSLRHLTSTLLSEGDWERIADVSEDFLRQEEEGFRAVQSSAPADLDPALMPVEPQRAGQQRSA